MLPVKRCTFRPAKIESQFKRGEALAIFAVMRSMEDLTEDFAKEVKGIKTQAYIDGVLDLAERLKEALFEKLKELGPEIFEVVEE